jgi:hypothetical protein
MLTNYPTAEKLMQVKNTIDHAMLSDLRLAAPAQYAWTDYNDRAWMLAALPRESLGKATEQYFDSKVLRHLSDVTGLPVTANRRAMMYLILLSARPRLSKRVDFPAEQLQKDLFGFGISIRGAVNIPAPLMENVMIGGTQRSGKSNLLKVIAHLARFNGWPLYICDPQGHTFNPDVWNAVTASPVIQDMRGLDSLVEKVNSELKRREELYRLASRSSGGIPPADIEAYNKVAEHLSRFMLVIDEANDFLEDKALERRLAHLARYGRKFGLHIVVAAHRWADNRGAGVSRDFSSRFPTRISLRVSDDTSGVVVLENQKWGNWVQDKPPGTAVIRYNGKHIPFKVYFVPPEVEAGWLENATAGPAPLITEQERQMVQYAVDELEGAFTVLKIVEKFADMGATQWRVRILAEKWEKIEYLTTPADAISPRLVTPKLADLAGVNLKGSKAANDIKCASNAANGAAQAAQGDAQDRTGEGRRADVYRTLAQSD